MRLCHAQLQHSGERCHLCNCICGFDVPGQMSRVLSSESPNKLLRALHCSGSFIAPGLPCPHAHFRVALEKTAYLPLLLLACGPICSLIGDVSTVSIVVQTALSLSITFLPARSLRGPLISYRPSDGRPMAYVFVRAKTWGPVDEFG